MDNVAFLIFRRMRAPLIVLIIIYSVSVMGLVLIPGQDAEGNLWHMDFFHAFYFFSYTATTIGFGEIPYAFTDAQRAWVTIAIYLTVVGWFYSIGTLIALLQDMTFQHSLAELRFARRIRRMREPFYLICGYGETGSALVQAITDGNRHAVVIDQRQERVDLLQLENLREYVPALHGDARRPHHLLEAGLKHPLCAAVVALTDVNETNLKIAIAAKLMHPKVKVVAVPTPMRWRPKWPPSVPILSMTLSISLAPIGDGHRHALPDPDEGLAVRPAGEPLQDPPDAARRGSLDHLRRRRFGKAIVANLGARGMDLVVVEAAPELTGKPEGYPWSWGGEPRPIPWTGGRAARRGSGGGDPQRCEQSLHVMTVRPSTPISISWCGRITRRTRTSSGGWVRHCDAPEHDHRRPHRVLLVTPLLPSSATGPIQDHAWSANW